MLILINPSPGNVKEVRTIMVLTYFDWSFEFRMTERYFSFISTVELQTGTELGTVWRNCSGTQDSSTKNSRPVLKFEPKEHWD